MTSSGGSLGGSVGSSRRGAAFSFGVTVAFGVGVLTLGVGCGDEPVEPDAGADAGVDAGPPRVDAGPPVPVSIAHCEYTQPPPTALTGGAVSAGALSAGVAEALLDVPLGASLAAYTSRSEGVGREGFLPEPDNRRTYLAGSFAPSVGIETIPRIRAIALSAGGETVVLLKIDLATSYQGFVHDVEAALGPEYSGKVLVATSHSHSSFGNYSGHAALAVGFGRFRSTVYQTIIEQLTAAAQAAIADLQPAQIGFALNAGFDAENRVNRDRRGENDELVGGPEDDSELFVIRVDTAAGEPMALVPVFGMHGTLQGGDNALISTDAPGGIERVLEESFDSNVLVMFLQGAAGDVSPAGSGAIDCGGATLCSDFAKAETVGHYALAEIRAAWESAGGAAMQTELPIEMITRTVPLGPDWSNFSIRDGALEYAPWDGRRFADGVVLNDDGELVSPIDEFNAPYGAALCGAGDDLGFRLPRAKLPGTDGLAEFSYFNCNRIDQIASILEITVDVEFGELPICETTQTTVSALRLGDWMMATLPGEPVTQLRDHLQTLSPVADDHTIIVGYAQDHIGYMLRPEDWIRGGYEPSITFWGPLEGEYVAEQAASVMALAATDTREDGNAAGVARVATPTIADDVELDTTADVGTVPATVPAYLLTQRLQTVTAAQPAATVERLDTVFFTFIGDDPLRGGTARVFLQRDVGGTFEDVVRRSGRPVQDGDLILTWTPDPIFREAGTPRTHYYTVEFQAAAPLGMSGLEALEDRPGLPLGSYRFRVEHSGYELTSAPFEVVPAQLSTTVETSGSDATVTIGFEASTGYRLLDLSVMSNGFVPVRSATVDVVVSPATGPDRTESLTTDADGRVTITGAVGASVTITDRFGNTATIDI